MNWIILVFFKLINKLILSDLREMDFKRIFIFSITALIYIIALIYLIQINAKLEIIGAYVVSGISLIIAILNNILSERDFMKQIKTAKRIDDVKEEKKFYCDLAHSSKQILKHSKDKVRLSKNHHVCKLIKMMDDNPSLIKDEIWKIYEQCHNDFRCDEAYVSDNAEKFLNMIIKQCEKLKEEYSSLTS